MSRIGYCFRQWFSRRRRYDDLSVSVQEHIAEKVEELMEEGIPRLEAEQAARRAFGNVTLLEERSREVWQSGKLRSFAADLRLVARRLRKAPGFAASAILTVAIGIGANTAVFSVLNSVLLKPLPYSHPDQLLALQLSAPGAAGLTSFSDGLRLSASMYFTFAEQNRTFQSLGIWAARTANVTGLAQPEEVHTVLVSDGVLEALRTPPAVGRWLSHADQDPRGARNVMLGYGYWQRRFGGDPAVVGRTITLDAQPKLIVGVMPRGFRLVDTAFDLLVPLALDPNRQPLAGFAYEGIGRLKPGVSIRQADADVARMVPLWMDSWSNGPGTDPHWYQAWRITPNLCPLKQKVIGNVGSVLWVVMATIALVMLIACANVANLQLVRAEARKLELSIRAALGAGRARIARELLLESVSIGCIGGIVGVGVAYAGLRLLLSMSPASLPRLSEISLDARSLVFTLILSLLCGLLFGSIPAWKYARRRNSAVVSGGARTASVSREHHRSRNVLVVAQVAMSLVLLVSAALMIRTFQRLRHVDPGFTDAEHLQTMRISIPDSLIADPQLVARTQNDVADRLAAIPGVRSVGFASAVPMEGIEPNWDLVYTEGMSYDKQEPLRLFNYASPQFFRTMGTHVLAGREFSWTDVYGAHPVAIVSASLAREFWGTPAAAIGRSIREFSIWHEVIGVVEDVHQEGIDQKSPATVYWPTKMGDYHGPDAIDFARSVTFVMRSQRAGTDDFVNEVQRAVWSVNANLPVASIRTMEEIYSQSLARTSFTLVMLAIAGSMALLLGVIGIYGVISYSVSQRRRELGIRLALGAPKTELRWMIVRSALMLTGVGIAIGLCTAAALMQLMKSLLFGISPFDPLTYVTIPLVLAASAAMASYLPARRAAAVDPAEVLRAE